MRGVNSWRVGITSGTRPVRAARGPRIVSTAASQLRRLNDDSRAPDSWAAGRASACDPYSNSVITRPRLMGKGRPSESVTSDVGSMPSR